MVHGSRARPPAEAVPSSRAASGHAPPAGRGAAAAPPASRAAGAGESPAPPAWRRRLRQSAPALVLVALLGFDLSRPAASQASARLLLGGIHLYQATLSPRMPALGVRCRFRPSCSRYAAGAIARYGALSGGLRAIWRIARCGPWTAAGTYDPP
jgi:uncharacterized protein